MNHATITTLEVENVKRIKIARIDPKTGTVIITGQNDQGKTSILDAIDWAFRGDKVADAEPIRAGEKRASVKLKLSEELNSVCTIERRWTASGSVLEIKNAEGVAQKTPQALLDTIIAKICFDPLSFIRLKAAEQLELLRKLVGLDFTEINKARQAAYDERTARNRELETAKAKLAALPFDPNLGSEPVNPESFVQKLADIRNKNGAGLRKKQELASTQAMVAALVNDVVQIESDIAELNRQIEAKRMQIAAKKNAITDNNSKIKTLEAEIVGIQVVDESAVTQELQQVNRTNQLIQQNQQHLKAKEELDTIAEIIKGLNVRIADLDEQKSAQIEFATFPMEGLSFDEERGVLLKGVPFQQGSQARQLQAAVSIGLALNPAVRVVIIRDGSLLDDKSLAMVSDMCAGRETQLWIEIVNSKDPSAIIIEDGEVKK